MFDTIVAIATPLAVGAISIIRMSGDQSFEIIQKIFSRTLKFDKGFRAYLGNIVDPSNQQVIDQVIVTVFKAPKSYTREDVIEINCHGGVYITKRILQLCLMNGSRLANPGEFSQRAYLNGRLDLAQVESTMDLINATNEHSARIAIEGIGGNVSGLISPLAKELMDIIAHIETNIDYPEYQDVEVLTHSILIPKCQDLLKKLNHLYNDSKQGQVVKDGLKTAIVGKPNVGKSSLLNLLIGEDKALVTNIAGTTRDVVEGSVRLDNIVLDLMDTAGIHETDDLVEKMGVDKSLKVLNSADLILLVIDGSKPLDVYDHNLLLATENKNRIIVYNKQDLGLMFTLDDNSCAVSVLNQDIQSLVKMLNDRYYEYYQTSLQPFLVNERQLICLSLARDELLVALSDLEQNQVLDLVNIDLYACYKHLTSIIMPVDQIDLVHEIFSRFCLGK